jgi:hypothetical protein
VEFWGKQKKREEGEPNGMGDVAVDRATEGLVLVGREREGGACERARERSESV